jgi:hypothetical protein
MLKSVTRIDTAYSATLIVCFYFNFVSLCMDTFAHRGQLVYAMKKLILFIGLILVVRMHLSFRQSILESLFTTGSVHLLQVNENF